VQPLKRLAEACATESGTPGDGIHFRFRKRSTNISYVVLRYSKLIK
jgi:hypothetical protein